MTTALIVGGSRNVRAEYNQALELFIPDIVIAVNDIGCTLPNIDHWVTLHPSNWHSYLVSRRALGLSMNFMRWSQPEADDLCEDNEMPKLNLVVPDFEPSGLSGLYAVKIAFHLKIDKMVLAGIPMDQSGHYSGNTKKHWINHRRIKAWDSRMQLLMGKVKSMSGFTAERFGVPTEEWLHGSKTQAQTAPW